MTLRCYGWLILYYPVWGFSSVMTKHPGVMPLSAGEKGQVWGEKPQTLVCWFLASGLCLDWLNQPLMVLTSYTIGRNRWLLRRMLSETTFDLESAVGYSSLLVLRSPCDFVLLNQRVARVTREFKTLGFVPCVTCLLTARKGFGTRWAELRVH